MCPLEVIPKITLPIKFLAIKVRHGKTGRSCRVWIGSIGLRVKRVTCQKLVILSGLKMSSSQLVAGQVKLTHIFHMNFLFFLFFYKENNMYLPFGKLCNKLLDVKCIILNSPLILRMNSVKFINTYSILLKFYKS